MILLNVFFLQKPKETVPTLAPKTLSVAAAFNEDEDSEPEEMPPEAKMRMKNIGRYIFVYKNC